MPWLWGFVIVTACLYISGVSGSAIAERTVPSGPVDCAVNACLESEEAYSAYLEPTEPDLPWSQIHSVRFENGELVVRLNDSEGSQLWAALDGRVAD
jgi:hypothetical protein